MWQRDEFGDISEKDSLNKELSYQDNGVTPGSDVFVFLEPNHGGLTSVERLSTKSAFEQAMREAFVPDQNEGVALATLHTVLSRAACWRMRIGNLDRAIWHLHRFARC